MGFPRESHETRPGETIPLARAALADRYSSLYEQWDATGRQHCGDSWRSPGELAGRHRIREALNHPELAGRTDNDIRHGLAMLRAECEERASLGQDDAWRWYRQAWTPRVLSSACDIPDEATARNRASPHRKAKTTTWMDEVKAEIEAEERARANS